jgi:hypothetical protein
MDIIIAGFGEIGRAWNEVQPEEYNVRINDIENRRERLLNEVDVLNICFPYDGDFITECIRYIELYDPSVTIIHSTVDIGTTDKIRAPTESDVFHSPVIGVHPYLAEGIKTFPKWIGGKDGGMMKYAEEYLDQCVDDVIVCKSIESEALKLLSTTYYGMCIAFHGEVKKLFEGIGADIDLLSMWTDEYNRGYERLGKKNVRRPMLYPPGEKIGGHCVVPNAKILKGTFSEEIINLILKYS